MSTPIKLHTRTASDMAFSVPALGCPLCRLLCADDAQDSCSVQVATRAEPAVCAVLQFILGAAGFLWPKFGKASREALVPYHMFLGRATFIVGLATMAVRASSASMFTTDLSCFPWSHMSSAVHYSSSEAQDVAWRPHVSVYRLKVRCRYWLRSYCA